MDKFSLYELLSFIIPGFTAIAIFKLIFNLIFGCSVFEFSENNFIIILLLTSIALCLGVLLQIISFRILDWKRFKWFREIVYQSADKIKSKSNHLSKIFPYLNERNEKIGKHHVQNELSIDDIFHMAYYYLETNEKIGPTKNFQSLYFWLRNTSTLCMIYFPISLIIFIIVLISDNPEYSMMNAFIFIISDIGLFLLLLIPTKWLREKMTIKLFWSYYSELIHQENQNSK